MGTVCAKCGQDHRDRCTAHKKPSRTAGVLTPCKRFPPTGGHVCVMHGGKAPTTIQAVSRRRQEAVAVVEAARFAVRQDVDPTTALLDLVQYQAGIVAYWRQRVEDVPEKDLTWGTVKVVSKLMGGDEEHEAAVPSVVYQMLRQAQQDLAEYASSALRAGVEERRVRIAEQQGEMFAAAQRAILARMFESVLTLLRDNGVTEDKIMGALTRGWAEAMGVIVPEELRAIAGRVA